MEKEYFFKAVIEQAQRGGAYVTVPFDVEAAFGKKRVKVRATIDGIPYQGSLVRMGGPGHILGILKAIRKQLGKDIGDTVSITLSEDTEERVVAVPEDLQALLGAHPRALAFFQQLSYSHQRNYVNWINEAKQKETRQLRINKSVDMLLMGMKR